MTFWRRHRYLTIAGLVAVAVMIVSVSSSFRFHPDPSADRIFMARAQQKSAPGITVSASALGPRESRRSFGENLARHNIQPLWLSIQNDTDDPLIFLPIETDPDYYSPFEVSYRFHGAFSFAANRERDAFFLSRQISTLLLPHARTEGFIYGVVDAGIKYAHIAIAGPHRMEYFDFALPVPGPAFLGAGATAEKLYPDRKLEDLDLDALRPRLAAFACCTANAGGTRDGDPINVAVVESARDPIIPFVARGWHLTQKLNLSSMLETARAFLFRDEYLTSPVSPLYVFDRREDVALQKARSTINERVHARFWLAPFTFQSRHVWIGQISRDIGVRLTAQTWNLTTHKIAPDVDFDRGYLLQDLMASGFVERFGYVTGVGAAPASAPRTNLTGDPYYTDGLRLVVFLSNEPRPMGEAERLPWEVPITPREEAR
jgi:hypothetical protein